MKNKTDKNMPIGKLTRVANLLPPPEKLKFPDTKVKITMYLDKSSVDFFKQKARQYHTKYQTMIRTILDTYTVRCLSIKD